MLPITNESILTAGPAISEKEVEYVTDAVINGWNLHHSDYIKKFEQSFANYIGVKYAMTTSSCTGALHLALLSLGIGPGDEVIVPEITWIATASVVTYVGAKPVFADIDPETWVLDSNKVARHITPRTKAIMPVHLYGHPVDMAPLNDLSEKYGIAILEDAAPSIGSEFNGKKTGSLGHAAAFSFQGAKTLVTGEGGMLVTNDENIMERARFLNDHGRDPNRTLFNIEIGYKYKMSNLQAALGLAQTERAEEIVAKKREIYEWYNERLGDIEGLRLNIERPWARSIFWMSSITLGKEMNISRDEFMVKLKERNIDSRPFFYPISSFPMFDNANINNPVAYDVPLRGINLPSGHERTEEEIDYVCAHIQEIVGKQNNKIKPQQPHGWLAYRDKVTTTIDQIKSTAGNNISNHLLQITTEKGNIAQLRPLTFGDIDNEAGIELLSDWRIAAQEWFPSQFRVTTEGTKRWLENAVLKTKDRILYFIDTAEGTTIGHVGLFRFDFKKKSCELDNVIRGVNGSFKGGMSFASRRLLDYAFEDLGIENVYLRVFSDNKKAIDLYRNIGFKEISRQPIEKISENDVVRWIDVIGKPHQKIERYFVTMKLPKDEYK